MDILIGLLFGLLSAFLAFSFILRRYLIMKASEALNYQKLLDQKREKIREAYAQLNERQTALNKIIDKVYHGGYISFPATLEGLLNLGKMFLRDAKLNTNLATRPNHHLWAGQAMKDLQHIDENYQMLTDEVLKFRKNIIDSVKEFENLQSK